MDPTAPNIAASVAADSLPPDGPRLLAIGNFDGVHRGHQYLITQVVDEARRARLRPAVLTFDPHPSEVLGRSKKATLTSLPLKLSLLKELSSELEVLVEAFTVELAAQTPRQFAQELIAKYHARQVLVGKDFRFGNARSGNLQILRELGSELGFSASAAELFTAGELPISSSRIRRAITEGDLASAETMLGRRHQLVGVVAQGDQRGRQLGYPTANFTGVEELLPPNGVYAGYVYLKGESYRAIANVGVRPTLQGPVSSRPSVEVHLLDFSGDLYGRTMAFEISAWVREERKFSNLQDLKKQIERDARTVIQRLPWPPALRRRSSV